MTRTYTQHGNGTALRARESVERKDVRARMGWCPLGAVAGFSGGLVAAVTGSVLTSIYWFTKAGAVISYLHTTGTILLIMTIPLFIFGAHCLDLMDKRRGISEESHLREGL